jgi:hypothetical protein
MLSFLIVTGIIALTHFAVKLISKQVGLGLAEWATREADLRARKAEIEEMRVLALRSIDDAAERLIIEIREEQQSTRGL